MNDLVRRRAISNVPLLSSKIIVLRNSTGGSEMCRQSVEAPWRTIMALVNAANDMLMAAIPTQMALLGAGPGNEPDLIGGTVLAIIRMRFLS
jgi:hypothetical protein